MAKEGQQAGCRAGAGFQMAEKKVDKAEISRGLTGANRIGYDHVYI